MSHSSLTFKKAFKSILIAAMLWLGVTAHAATRQVTVGPSGALTFVDAVSGNSSTTINVGDTVTWVWASGGHSTTSADGLWDSGVLSGGSFSHTFNSPGTFNYFCTPHRTFGMTGTVVVNAPPDFGVSVSNANGGTVGGPIFPGQTTIFNGTLSPMNGYNHAVNLSCVQGSPSLPSPCTPNPASPNVSAITPFTITAGASAVGHYTFNAQGTDGTNTRAAMGLNFDVVDFGIGAPASAVTVFSPASGTANSTSTTVVLSGAGAFAGNVSLSCTGGLPGGATCGFTPAGPYMPTAASPVSVTVRITVPAGTTAQDYNVTLSAASTTGAGTVTRTQTLMLHVVQFNAGSFSPPSVTIGAGNVSGPTTTQLMASANFLGSVALVCTAGLPPGGACNFMPNPVSTFPSSPSMTASVPTDTAGGTYNLTVTATGSIGELSSNQALPLMLIVPPPGFSLGTPSPASLSMANNAFSQPVTVLLTPVNFSGPVSLGCGNLPSGVTCLFSPSATVNVGGAPVTFAVAFEANNATPNTYSNITITGSATVNGTPIMESVGLTQLTITSPATSTTIASNIAGVNSATNGTLINVGDPRLVFTVTVNNTGSVYSGAIWEVDFSGPVALVASSNPNCSQVIATAITCNVGDIPVGNGNQYSFNVAPLFGRSLVAQSVVTSPTVGSTNLAGNQATATAIQVRPRPLARRGLVPKLP